jgi:hypothetical protein
MGTENIDRIGRVETEIPLGQIDLWFQSEMADPCDREPSESDPDEGPGKSAEQYDDQSDRCQYEVLGTSS